MYSNDSQSNRNDRYPQSPRPAKPRFRENESLFDQSWDDAQPLSVDLDGTLGSLSQFELDVINGGSLEVEQTVVGDEPSAVSAAILEERVPVPVPAAVDRPATSNRNSRTVETPQPVALPPAPPAMPSTRERPRKVERSRQPVENVERPAERQRTPGSESRRPVADRDQPPRVPGSRAAGASATMTMDPSDRTRSQVTSTLPLQRENWQVWEPLIAAALALVITVMTYAVTLVLGGTFIGRIFWSGFPIPLVITLLGYFALSRLAVRRIFLFFRQQMLNTSPLPLNPGEKITTETAQGHLDRLNQSHGLQHHPLRQRLARLLSHFATHGDLNSLERYLESISTADANRSAAAYSSVKLIVWALPILGFLGTVIGISAAVGEFSGAIESAGDLDIIKNSLSGVTGGLAVSFETTLLALLFSMLVMFPKSLVLKAEEFHLLRLDEQCREIVASHFQSSQRETPVRAATNEPAADWEKIFESMQSRWSAQAEQFATQLGQNIADMLGVAVQSAVAATEAINRRGAELLHQAISQSMDAAIQANQKIAAELRALTEVGVKENRQFVEAVQGLRTRELQQTEQLFQQLQVASAQIRHSLDSVQPIQMDVAAGMKELLKVQQQLGEQFLMQSREAQSLAHIVREQTMASAAQLRDLDRQHLPPEVIKSIVDTRSFAKATVKELQHFTKMFEEHVENQGRQASSRGWWGRLMSPSVNL